MTRIEVTLTGTTPTTKLYGALVSGMVGVQVAFSFDSDWDGLNKTAVFQGCCTKTRALVLTNETTVPYEVLQAGEGVLYIGVEGRKEDGTIVYPSVMARVGSIRTGADTSADLGMKPCPTVYDDIMAAVRSGILQGPAGPEGPQGIPGEDGKDGVSCTHSWNGTVLTVTSASGSTSVDLRGDKGDPGKDGAPGADGQPGADGYTPQKGVDYYTEADKQEMVAAVLAAMPTWKGGSY